MKIASPPKQNEKLTGLDAWLPGSDSYEVYEVYGTAENLLIFSKHTKLQHDIFKNAMFIYEIRSDLELLFDYDVDSYEKVVFMKECFVTMFDHTRYYTKLEV